MTKTPTNVDPIESARKVLNAAASTIADLEAESVAVSRILAGTDVELEEMARRRKALLASDMPVAELDGVLARHDEGVRSLIRRNEIAAAVSTKLAESISSDRENKRAASQLAAYNEAVELQASTASRIKEFLERVGAESRDIMRAYASAEKKAEAANKDLPPGAAPVRSIEAVRRGEIPQPKTTIREFSGFVEVGGFFVSEQGKVQAAARQDGKREVYRGRPSGSGEYFICTLVEYVEVTVETASRPNLDNLASALSIPAFSAGQRPGWTSINHPASAHRIQQMLEELERPLPPPVSDIKTRTMTKAAWLKVNGDAVADAPRQVELAAE